MAQDQGQGLLVISAGHPRTGSKSLQFALHRLGIKNSYHMSDTIQAVLNDPNHQGDWPNWFSIYEKAVEARKRGEVADLREEFEEVFGQGGEGNRYLATTDMPGLGVWKELIKAYPDAKVILHERDFESWYESCLQTIYARTKLPPPPADSGSPLLLSRKFHTYIFGEDSIFEGKMETDIGFVKSKYNEHNEEVKRVVPKERLLVGKVSDGWGPLCEFLGKEIPRDSEGNEESFPEVNTREEFTKRQKDLKETGSFDKFLYKEQKNE